MNTRRKDHLNGIIVGALAIAATSGIVWGDVLYDNLGITDNGTYTTAAQNYIGGLPSAQNGNLWDVQAADDFTLGNSYAITTITADLLATNGLLPANVLVEFFSDVGGAPSATAAAAVFTTNFSTSNFTNHLSSDVGIRFTVDIEAAGIVLNAGAWWVSVVPVDETNGERYFWARQTGQPLSGASANTRDGGASHGDGLPGPFSNNDWSAFGTFGPPIPPFQAGDLAMRIDGIVVPAPPVMALVALFGLSGGRRRR